MSTLETLHKAVDNMPENVLEHIALRYDEYLPAATEVETQENDGLLKRYEHYKANPETALTSAESKRRLYERYGWSAQLCHNYHAGSRPGQEPDSRLV